MKNIFIDFERCQGCKSCELACAVEHSKSKNLFAAITETLSPKKRLFVESGEGKIFPVQCRHCEKAPCVAVCVSGALNRDESKEIVSHNKERCIKCSMCVMVCPFGVILKDLESKAIIKCDRCPDREEPACVEACPVEALFIVDPKEKCIECGTCVMLCPFGIVSKNRKGEMRQFTKKGGG